MNLQNIFKHLHRTKRIPILFVGSGITRRYIENFYNWKELLLKCIEAYNSCPKLQYDIYLTEIQFTYRDANEALTYQLLGEYIEKDFNINYLQGNIKDFIAPVGTNPLKAYIASILSEIKVYEDMIEEIALLKELNARILTVITTNYDQFLEKNVFVQHETVVGQEIFQASELFTTLKIHGCISDSNSLVLTKGDYEKFDKKSKVLTARIINLFAENPVIFLGYSINDENVHRILRDIYSCLDDNELEIFEKRLIFVEYKKEQAEPAVGTHSVIVDASLSITLTKITLEDFGLLYKELHSLEDGYEYKEIKRLSNLVHNIVYSSKPTKTKIVTLSPEDEDIGDKELVVAFGKKDDFVGKLGLKGLSLEHIYDDIIKDNLQHIESSLLIEETIPSLLIGNQYLPLYKYLQSPMSVLEPIIVSFINEYDNPSRYLNKTIANSKNSFDGFESKRLEEIFQASNLPFTKKMNYLALSATFYADAEELESFLQAHHTTLIEQNTTYFRKLVCIYDYKKYQPTALKNIQQFIK